MIQIINSTTPVAKKVHKCNFCLGKIAIGEKYDYDVCVNDGDLYPWKAHVKCNELASKLNMYYNCEEGVTDDDFYEIIRNQFQEMYQKKEGVLISWQDIHKMLFKEQLDYVYNNLFNKQE